MNPEDFMIQAMTLLNSSGKFGAGINDIREAGHMDEMSYEAQERILTLLQALNEV